nr:potassium transporter Kup [Fibrella sp. ES10-3-2-2]
MSSHASRNIDKMTAAGLLVAVGIVFGDIGTSPLYTYRAIIEDRIVDETLALGGVSAIFWTLTFQTTLKYVLLTLRADNNGEGGIFSLYTLIRRYAKWLLFPAIAGGSFLIADSIITPPISVSSAIEGLLPLYPDLPTVPIVLAIIFLLFAAQQAGTDKLGKAFGPIMSIWFTMIGLMGALQLAKNPGVVRALNPVYAYDMIVNYPDGFWLLGGVFLCSTGAEALYSDMGHVGRRNVQVSWFYVKICLILCYLGQAAWLLDHMGKPLGTLNSFFGLVPDWFMLPSIGIATLATIIASQALISGTFTLVSEAFRLTLLPKMRIVFPSNARGQVYIPAFNWLLMAGCFVVVLYFRESKNMEAAFGLSVNLTMLTTTVLLGMYLYAKKRINGLIVLSLLLIYFFIEGGFLIANLRKFTHGGWVSLLLGSIMLTVMLVWHNGSRIKRRLTQFVSLRDHLPMLRQLSNDTDVPKYATNLVYLTASPQHQLVEEHILDSILEGMPKRADLYWLIHIELVDDPFTTEYVVDILEPEDVIRITFKLGFRVQPRINLLFRKVVEELVRCHEITIKPRYRPLKPNPNAIGDFRFIVINRFLSYENELSLLETFIMNGYFALKRISLADESAYGLDSQNVATEQIPLVVNPANPIRLRRVKNKGNVDEPLDGLSMVADV